MRPLGAVPRDQRGFTIAELLVTCAIVGLVMAAVLNVYMTGNTIGQTQSNKAQAQQAARGALMVEEDLRLAGYGYPAFPPAPTPAITAATATSITFMADLMSASTTLSAAANAGVKTVTLVPPTNADIKVGDTIYLINGGQAANLIVSLVAGNTITLKTPVTCPGIPNPCYPAGAQVGRPRAISYSWNAATLTLSKDAGDGTGLLPLATNVQNLRLRYFDATETEILPAGAPPQIPAAQLPNIRRIQIQMTAQSATAQNRGTFTVTSAVRPRNL